MKRYLRSKVVQAFVKDLPSGSFFTVVFDKIDGTVRKMNCRQEVVKHLTGGKKTNSKDELITTYSLDAAGYRSFYSTRVTRITGSKEVLEIRN